MFARAFLFLAGAAIAPAYALCVFNSSATLHADEGATSTLSGTILDGDGKPVAEAEVLLSDGPMLNARLEGFYRDIPLTPQVITRPTPMASFRST